jgi:hypothetical protein
MNRGYTGYRVRVDHHHHFARDELLIYVVFKDEKGTKGLKPIKFEVDDKYLYLPTEPVESTPLPEPIVIKRELAEPLFEALAYTLLGVAEPIYEIQRLRRELTETKLRLDKLIDGIGRIGGNKD